jgi:hypothetical protein
MGAEVKQWSHYDYEVALDLGQPLTDEQLAEAEAGLMEDFEVWRKNASAARREMDRIGDLLYKITVRRRMRKAANDRT